MITKLYIDNFRCFTNFELELDRFHLFLGANGSGKSSVFDALLRVQRLLSGESVERCFPIGDLTAWESRTAQSFAIEISVGEDSFRYEVCVEHSPAEKKQRIGKERLLWNSQVLYRLDGGDAHVYRVRGSEVVEGTHFLVRGNSSFIPLLEERGDNQPVFRFRQAVRNCAILRLIPPCMESMSEAESAALDSDGGNFSSWYRYLAQSHPEITSRLAHSLEEVIPGIQHLRFETVGEAKRFEAAFRMFSRPLSFAQLSDGQRSLIVLYTLLHAAASLGYSLFIDEPDNYVSLRESQPWLRTLDDLSREHGKQANLISHHPEIINLLAKEDGIWFTRPNNEHVIARREYPVAEGLTAAETMARGWDDE